MPPNAPECPTRSRANAPRMPPLKGAILWPLPGVCGFQSDGRGAYPTLRDEQSWALACTGPNETQARWPSQFLPIFRACLIQTGPKLGKNWRSGLFLISPHSQVAEACVLCCLVRRARVVQSLQSRSLLSRLLESWQERGRLGSRTCWTALIES